MKLNELAGKKNEWLLAKGPEAAIAVSTRMRVARNLKGHVYFSRASEKQREKTLKSLITGLAKSKYLKKALVVRMRDVPELERMMLVERYLMSREHAQQVAQKALAVEENEAVSVMLNEEDHIRLQVIQPGFNVMETWRIVDEVDTDLSGHLQYDFSRKFGYLTSCPTNTGTGLRASVMLHLAGLVMTGQIDAVLEGISKLGLTMRGFYGEGTEASGDLFQISNQVALGHSEMDILDNLERIIARIIKREKQTREEFTRKKKIEVQDRIDRSYGTLKSARVITSNETVKLLSAIRLGIDLGMVSDLSVADVNEIMLITQPAHLQKVTGRDLAPSQRDIARADLIRERLDKKKTSKA
ncbi:MAG: protein arginine kinase [Candidatus Omnitrophica bacterium]|nr:protein arginine kinase [Candidatus Omnitrophota bacterium]